MGDKRQAQACQQTCRDAAGQVCPPFHIEKGRNRRQAAEHRPHPAGHLNEGNLSEEGEKTPQPVGQGGQEDRGAVAVLLWRPLAHQGILIADVIEKRRSCFRHLRGKAEIEIGIHFRQIRDSVFVQVFLPERLRNGRQGRRQRADDE